MTNAAARQAKGQMAEGQIRTRRAAHALIAVTYVGGPERLYRVAVCYTDGREVDGLTYGAGDYPTGAALGNALWHLFNCLTVQQALDALPAIKTVLSLAA
jgi:hypothetical protein